MKSDVLWLKNFEVEINVTKQTQRLTAAQVILLAANDLDKGGKNEFSEFELTEAAWLRDKNRFGLRGFEEKYPDHKRVMSEVMGQTKCDNPVRRKFIEKTRANHYRLTDLGRSEASIQADRASQSEETVKSPAKIYAALCSFAFHPAFERWLASPEEPRSWVSAAAFLGLKNYKANELNDCIRALHRAVEQATKWCTENGRDRLRDGPTGGAAAILLDRIHRLPEFLKTLEERFSRQMTSIRSKEA